MNCHYIGSDQDYMLAVCLRKERGSDHGSALGPLICLLGRSVGSAMTTHKGMLYHEIVPSVADPGNHKSLGSILFP